jgi:hypothetical protein
MGDLVRSERASSLEQLHALFNAAVERQNSTQAAVIVSPLTITLGDEFQGLVTSLVAAATMARNIRLDLLTDGVDCRFAVGLATVKTPLNTERAWNMLGPGLAETRARLNDKQPHRFYRFLLPDDAVIETLLEACGAAATRIEQGWTATQQQVAKALLQGVTPAELASLRHVSVHSIYKVRASAGFDVYAMQWAAIAQALAALDACHLGPSRRS